jgi:filamentous hemagglutinin family protein
MMQVKYLKFIKAPVLLIGLFFAVISQTVFSLPEEGVVSSGDAIISSNHAQLEINQQSHKTVIDWRSFNIEANEQTTFIQPSSDSVALNRINSNTASEINGRLIANGKLILINQNGIFFGKTANVDVNGLIATTANISNEKFMQQETINDFMLFDQPGGKTAEITNQGTITAKDGLVGLVAPNIMNEGLIIAKAAKVQLASGEIFALDLYGDSLINIAVSENLENQLLINSGKIIADGNQIALTAAAGKQLINSLIINSGALQARSVTNENGEIIIMAEGRNAVMNNRSELKGVKSGTSKVMISGLIDVTGLQQNESGGEVKILGDNIVLFEKAVIDASGNSGKCNTTLGLDPSAKRIGSAGGEILIGGDYLGKGKVPCATTLLVEPDVKIYSDSNKVGDAGRIIFWSDEVNNFSGQVYARSLGGSEANNYGNGGFVEVSGRKTLILHHGYSANLMAVNGAFGTLFLDPTAITINQAFLTNNNTADISISADDVNFDLASNTFNLGNDFNFTINSKTLVVTTGGVLNTNRTNAGGNININTESGAVDLSQLTFNAQNGAKVTINTTGTTTLGKITAGSLLVNAVGSASDIIIPATVQLTATSTTNPLILVAGGSFINNNVEGFSPLNLTGTGARWLLFIGDYNRNVGNRKPFLGIYTPLYEQVYDNNALPTAQGNLIAYAVSRNLIGTYDDRTVLNPVGQTNKQVTVTSLSIAGADAGNYRLVNTDKSLQTTVTGYVGTITPKPMVVTLDSTQKVSKTYDGTTAATLKDENYVLYDIVTVNGVTDDVKLTNHTVGSYNDIKAGTYANAVASGVPNPGPINYQGVSVSGIQLTGSDSVNYNLTSNSISSSNVGYIAPKAVTASLTGNVSKTYDNSTNIPTNQFNPANNFAVEEVLTADVGNVGVDVAKASARFVDENVGNSKAVTVANISLTGSAAGNYVLQTSIASGNIGTITPKSVVVNLVDNNGASIVSKNYDGNTSAVVYHDNYLLDGSYPTDDVFLNN